MKRHLNETEWSEIGRRAATEPLCALAEGVGYHPQSLAAGLRSRGLMAEYEPPTMPTNQTDVQAAYLAGFFDGEGHATVKLIGGKTYVASLGLTNTHRGVLDGIAATWGGRVRSGKVKANWKTPHFWSPPSRHVGAILTRILPYLVVKRRQAELILELRESLNAHRSEAGRGRPGVPLDEMGHRAWLREEIMRLNGRKDKIAKRVRAPYPAIQRPA